MFRFNVNGLPIFVKGANWVPMEFLPSMNQPQKYRKLLGMARDAGYNMLRVWGGGFYEDDLFYALCDSLGIMVWQDAMFACAMYPSDASFIENMVNEIRYQSQRLVSHPSLTLWCGNNENHEGWFNWGWQKQLGYSSLDSVVIWHGNRLLFDSIIPRTIGETYGTISFNYHPSSPAHGWGRPIAYKTGDVHYWGVWWGMEPFEAYRSHVGRFVSEYGFQAYPDDRTLIAAANKPIDSLRQPSLASHQKHPQGFETIDAYLKHDYPLSKSVAETIYLSQLMQADGVGEAICAHRLMAPYCMGSLFWQYSDCWNAISWSAVDYATRPKQLYYASKRLFNPSCS
jgi:beta-mannosidase